MTPLLVSAIMSLTPAAPKAPTFDAGTAERFVKLALDCVHQEYPNKIAHVLLSDADVAPPRELTPVFFGCFDWHSAVHGHWLLARAARLFPEAPFAAAARAALAKSFTAAKVAAEVHYLDVRDRHTFERPYGLAWILQLAAELHEWDDAEAKAWRATLKPLEKRAAERLGTWFPKLTHPIRTGEHSQTAFAMGLMLDWARVVDDRKMQKLIAERARDYYGNDVGCNLAFEPGGQDFLSPCLAEADLMRRVQSPRDFSRWLGRFLPDANIGGPDAWLVPAVVSDKSDGKLAHLDGLNLARAWMLEGIISGLPPDDRRLERLRQAARLHRDAGLAAVSEAHYEGGHWLGSFAMYLVTRRGIP